MTELRIRSATFGSCRVCVSLEGELDGRTSPELEREILELLGNGAMHLEFDLERLNVLTSAGAGVFLGGLVLAQERHGTVTLLRLRPEVRQVLELLGLDQMLTIRDESRLQQSTLGIRVSDRFSEESRSA